MVTDLSLVEASRLLAKLDLSPVELARAYLDRIAALDGKVQAFVTLCPDQALASAQRAEAELRDGGPVSRLHGIPIVVKDLLGTTDVPTKAGSRVLDGWASDISATAVSRLVAAGAVILGKVTTHEFAMDVITPPTRNPWDLERIPGGSSGGSAAAVAARMCLGAVGTDTGGSIRIPAALCGVSGLKPTYGRVSRAGVIPLSWSLDHVGPIAQTALDLAALLQSMAGVDSADPTSSPIPVPSYEQEVEMGLKGLRIGVPDDFFFDRVDSAASAAVHDAVDSLVSLGVSAESVSLPNVHLAPIVGDVISLAEASLYHQRWLHERASFYSPLTRAALLLGELISATDYVQAHRVRGLITQEFREAFGNVDAIVAPTTPAAAIRVDDSNVSIGDDGTESAVDAYCRLTYPADVTGFPAISLPCGLTPQGLPLGLQLLGRPFEEGLLLRIGSAFQQATQWHAMQPSETPA